MSVEQITAVVLAVGSAPVILKLIDWVKAVRSGRARDERYRNRMALSLLDETTDYLRIMQEYASRLRRILIELGVPEERIPAWPVRATRGKK